MPDRPTDRHVMHAEEVANLFHRVGVGGVGLCHGLIAVRACRAGWRCGAKWDRD